MTSSHAESETAVTLAIKCLHGAINSTAAATPKLTPAVAEATAIDDVSSLPTSTYTPPDTCLSDVALGMTAIALFAARKPLGSGSGSKSKTTDEAIQRLLQLLVGFLTVHKTTILAAGKKARRQASGPFVFVITPDAMQSICESLYEIAAGYQTFSSPDIASSFHNLGDRLRDICSAASFSGCMTYLDRLRGALIQKSVALPSSE